MQEEWLGETKHRESQAPGNFFCIESGVDRWGSEMDVALELEERELLRREADSRDKWDDKEEESTAWVWFLLRALPLQVPPFCLSCWGLFIPAPR